MQVKPLSQAVGAEVQGVDLRRPLSDDEFQTIRSAFLTHGVVILRNQHLNEEQFVSFAQRFAPLESYESTLKEFLKPDYPDIIVLSNIVENGVKLGVSDAGQYWHTDRSYVAKPAWSSVLYALRVPHNEAGEPIGDTIFASAAAAAAALPVNERRELEQMKARHEYVFRFTKPNDSMPGVEHPLFISHPVTGAPILYVNEGFTKNLVGVPEETSKEMLAKLYAFVARDEFTYRHKWRVGDVLMWDNYSTQHRAVGDYGPHQPRLMWRTTIQGFPLQHRG
jgi:taurine dioxygenase